MTNESTPSPAFGPFDANHPPPLHFDAWADVSALLLERSPDDHVQLLQARELDVELWDACNLFWLMELADQIARGNLKMADRYAARCLAEMTQRRAQEGVQQDERQLALDVDATAFMTALHDDTVLPFASQPDSPLPFDLPAATPATSPTTSTESSEPHPDVGETQEVSRVGDTAWPFSDEVE